MYIEDVVCRIESGIVVGTYRLFGNAYRTDGELGVQEHEVFEFQKWEKVDD